MNPEILNSVHPAGPSPGPDAPLTCRPAPASAPTPAELAVEVRKLMAGTAAEPLPEEAFDRLARRWFRTQYAAVPPYRRWCDRRGQTPETVGHWTEIPAVPTAAFKELEFTALTPAERTTVFESSGTTASRRSRHFHHADSLALYEASLWPWFRRHLLPEVEPPPALRWLALLPPSGQAPRSSLVHMAAAVIRQTGGDAAPGCFLAEVDAEGGWRLRTAETLQALEAAEQAGQPVALLGTAFSFVHLLDAMDAAGVRRRLPAGSRLMKTGGYKGRSREVPPEELERLLAERLGIPAAWQVEEYGMCELGSQAYDRVAGRPAERRLFRFPPWARAWVASPETGRPAKPGEVGLLRVFDLANVWSVSAIETGDLARAWEGGFELLGRTPGDTPRGCSLMPRAEEETGE
ncbi:MAG: long-chain fatty acid--CoA ligase [Verrucomicrobia bacterium]|nr:MAG: long-chain fatty acid--CoA ligase [Verrucomicrobiota bacterium]